MRVLLPLALLAAAGPAMAEGGYTLPQLLNYGFKVVAAAPVGAGSPTASHDVLYLQGRLPSGGSEIVVRCDARVEGDTLSTDCWQIS